MTPEEIYEKQVQCAADDHVIEPYMLATYKQSFISGIRWANSHPAPHIQKLLETLRKIAGPKDAPLKVFAEDQQFLVGLARTVLQEYERAVKDD